MQPVRRRRPRRPPAPPSESLAAAAREHLRERVRAAEAQPRATKTAIKALLLRDPSINWHVLRADLAQSPSFRAQNWKADLVGALLHRPFPHGGVRRGGRLPRRQEASSAVPEAVPAAAPGGEGEGEAAVTSDVHAPVVLAVLHLLRLLPLRTRRELLRRTTVVPRGEPHDDPGSGGGVVNPPSTPAAAEQRPARYATLLGRRRVRAWKGLCCFTVRILARTGYLERSAAEIATACATLVRWWDVSGRPRTVCLRPANAFTAHLPLLYTTLPPHDLLHDAACRQLHAPDDRPPAAAAIVAGAGAGAGLPAPPAPDIDAIPASETWRAFRHRFPVLCVYFPVWHPEAEPAATVLRGLAAGSAAADGWERRWSQGGGALGLPEIVDLLGWPAHCLPALGGETTLSMLARALQPGDPWEHWVRSDGDGGPAQYHRAAVWHLRRAAGLVLAFGSAGPAVVEAIRLPGRLWGEDTAAATE